MSLELERPFRGSWEDLIALSSRWVRATTTSAGPPPWCRERRARSPRAAETDIPSGWTKIYFVVHLREVRDDEDRTVNGRGTIAALWREIGQVIRGDTLRLSADEQKEVLASSMSYYPTDALVVGWLCAIVFDTAEGAGPLLELLEYANAQLLEYRRYDQILTNLLKHAYDALERREGLFARWKLSREAAQLNRLRLDIVELTERTDNAIKFLSDMYYARAYRLAAAKVGANDYRRLVTRSFRRPASCISSWSTSFGKLVRS